MFTLRQFIPGILTGFTVLANAPAQEGLRPPPQYYAATTGLSGDALLSVLHDIIDEHKEVRYSWLPFRDLDESTSNDSHVELVYSDATSPKENNGGSVGEWNREHLWPRNFGIGHEGPDNADLFNLRPSDVQVNSERGSLVYEDTDPEKSVPLQFSAPGCSKDNNSWEPRNDEKGDIARSCFYMATRYDGTEPATSNLRISDVPDASSARFGRLLTLIRWHHLDPVDKAERNRNHRIFTHWQGNRNPFIDHPEFVGLIFLSEYPGLDQDGDGIGDWWEYRQFGNLAMSGTDDPDHDSASNMLEFAVGSAPGDAGQIPAINFSAAGESINVFYNWNLAAKANGITATIQRSVNLLPGSWSNVQPIKRISAPSEKGSEQITLTLPSGEQPARVFYRLQVIASPGDGSPP
jgi:endonuclease I